VTRYKTDRTDSFDYWKIETYPATKMLAIDMSALTGEGERTEQIGNYYKTWFVPPKTTRYRFYMVCNDYCLMKMSTCPDSYSPLKTILDNRGWSPQNSFFNNEERRGTPHKKYSDWMELTEGQKYFMQVNYKDWWGDGHMKTGVEIEQS
jgi:hypothetical protein